MKLKKAIKIGKDCELDFVGDAILNIRNHAMSIFSYDEIQEELEELYKDFEKSGLKLTDSIENIKL